MVFIVGHDAQEVASDGVLLNLKLRLVLVSFCLFSCFFLRRWFGFLELDALKSSNSKREKLVIVIIRESSVRGLAGCVGVIARLKGVQTGVCHFHCAPSFMHQV